MYNQQSIENYAAEQMANFLQKRSIIKEWLLNERLDIHEIRADVMFSSDTLFQISNLKATRYERGVPTVPVEITEQQFDNLREKLTPQKYGLNPHTVKDMLIYSRWGNDTGLTNAFNRGMLKAELERLFTIFEVPETVKMVSINLYQEKSNWDENDHIEFNLDFYDDGSNKVTNFPYFEKQDTSYEAVVKDGELFDYLDDLEFDIFEYIPALCSKENLVLSNGIIVKMKYTYKD